MGAKPNIFILTDSDLNRGKIESALLPHFELSFFTATDQVLAELRKRIPDLIIIGQMVDGLKTFSFIDKVRNNPITRRLSFVIISRESSNEFVEKGVRSGVSHYIGIPFEPKMLVEKIKFALKQGQTSSQEKYFSLKAEHETHVTAFGRISFISEKGIHIETHLKLKDGEKIHMGSALSAALQKPTLEIQVTGTSSDTFYNYPFAVDADWVEEDTKQKVKQWIQANKHLNSPKKAKILIVASDISFEEGISKVINLSFYSIRFVPNVAKANEDIPFMKPACVVVSSADWIKLSAGDKTKFFQALDKSKSAWILSGDLVGEQPAWPLPPFQTPTDPASIAQGIEAVVKPILPEEGRLYFSKNLEDSRLKIYFDAKTLILGELGAKLALTREVLPPCNLQLSLKVFSEQELRNPYVRAWPPTSRVSSSDSEKGKYAFSVDCHFLGINDQQGQAIRKFLIDEQMKDRRKKIEDVAPVKKDQPVPTKKDN
ncbi:MAG: hypothetical protein J0L93_08100 [Deltaproteobacteria bacterium]|nr:hypothetical protein [Deltaproteobacteria bacterium]